MRKRAIKKFLDVIQSRADIYNKAIDGVGDLPRVFRVLGTRNYKLGVSNDAPICHIVEVNNSRFTPTEIDEKLEVLSFRPFYKSKVRGSKKVRPSPKFETVC